MKGSNNQFTADLADNTAYLLNGASDNQGNTCFFCRILLDEDDKPHGIAIGFDGIATAAMTKEQAIKAGEMLLKAASKC
jgi:hypothetical protein